MNKSSCTESIPRNVFNRYLACRRMLFSLNTGMPSSSNSSSASTSFSQIKRWTFRRSSKLRMFGLTLKLSRLSHFRETIWRCLNKSQTIIRCCRNDKLCCHVGKLHVSSYCFSEFLYSFLEIWLQSYLLRIDLQTLFQRTVTPCVLLPQFPCTFCVSIYMSTTRLRFSLKSRQLEMNVIENQSSLQLGYSVLEPHRSRDPYKVCTFPMSPNDHTHRKLISNSQYHQQSCLESIDVEILTCVW